MRYRVFFQCVLFVSGLSFLWGCGSDPRGPTSEVTGTVTYENKPVPSGTVIFYGPGDRTDTGEIKDGNYTVSQAIVGPNKITVRTPTPTKDTPGKMPTSEGMPKTGAPAESVAIPKIYDDLATTPLTFEVAKGKQKFNIELKK